jgi:hypothetical protein
MADWSPLRTMLAAVDTSVTLTWKDLDRLVGGLPRSACEHNAFWKGERSGWPGFRTSAVKVGESVTFARVGAPQGTARLTPVTPVLPRAGAADLVLVGCVKQKLPVPAPAKDLYTSPLFRKSRAYAEQAGVPWFVLSAEHGLVTPEQRLAPYDLRLSKTPREYRRAWGARVVDRLQQEVGPLTGKTIEVHAGAAYVEPIRPLLTHAGATVVEPLAGLKLGPRLAWYGATAEANAEGMVTLEAAADVSELTNQLKESERAVSPEVFLATGGDDLRSPGLYSWWVDTAGAADLSRGLGVDVSPGADLRRVGCGDAISEWAHVQEHAVGANQDDAPWRSARVFDISAQSRIGPRRSSRGP